MALTLPEIKRSTKPREKDFWLSDEKGLRMLVKTSGACYWRLKYRFGGKQKTLALGLYPEVSLKEARLARDTARLQIAQGIDPARERRTEKLAMRLTDNSLFSVLAREWWEHHKDTWTQRHAGTIWRRLRDNTFKDFDSIPLKKIKPQDVIATIRVIEARGSLDVAGRILQDIRRVFSYGVQIGRVENNPATDLKGVLKPYKSQHRASLPIDELGQFALDLRHYEEQGRLLTQLALQMLMFTFVRPGELRKATWKEFDIEKRLWRIPAERMKMRTEHLVPLSNQVLKIIEQIRPISGRYKLLFPSEKNRDIPMSDNTMRRAMFRLGYEGKTPGKSRATPHGFRANASSVLNEQGFHADAIERQLSHMERNNVRAAYTHHAQYLDDRYKIMQWWADYVDEVACKEIG